MLYGFEDHAQHRLSFPARCRRPKSDSMLKSTDPSTAIQTQKGAAAAIYADCRGTPRDIPDRPQSSPGGKVCRARISSYDGWGVLMRALFSTIGSRGDVQPVVALAS